MGGMKLLSVASSFSILGAAQDYFLEKRADPIEVQCTYSEDKCTANTCCPGANATGDRKYPCPTSHPHFWCGIHSAPKPISCGKMTSYGKEVCEQEKYCVWQEFKTDFATGMGDPTRNDTGLSASCVFGKKFSSTCYPPPQSLPQTNFSNPCFARFETNSGWPDVGMDWHMGRNWTELQADSIALKAAQSLGWTEALWKRVNVIFRGAYQMTEPLPASTFKWWPELRLAEKAALHILGWNEELWNYNVMAMIGPHRYHHCWPPVVYKMWSDLSTEEQEGMIGLGWIGEVGANWSVHVNHVFWEDAGDQVHGWPASQCQDWDHVNQTAVYQVFPDKSCNVPEIWNFYFRTLDPICPVSNPDSQ